MDAQWDDMRVLLGLLRAGNLHDAGAALGLDPSTVSRRLAALEKRTRAQLFVRTRDGLRPTATATRLRPHAERMEAEAAALIAALRADTASTRGVVRVATTEAFARLLVEHGLLDVRADHPELAIEILAGNHPIDLVRGEAELAVRLAALRQPSLRARTLATMPVGLFASRAYLERRGAIRGVASLRGHDVLVPSGDLGKLPEASWLAARPGVRVVFRSNCMPALVAAAAGGCGVVPLPVGWGDSVPELVRLLVLDGLGKRQIWLVSHEGAHRRPAVRVVGDRIAAIFARVF
ncbi:MAG TPA: LysR family transcriptional regulator [Kofleriaceae bacterium]|nr:LysR family transcriptional regulator [Kofleriaceae bacterium]